MEIHFIDLFSLSLLTPTFHTQGFRLPRTKEDQILVEQEIASNLARAIKEQ